MSKLNLGCGPLWKTQYPDYEGVDIIDFGQKYVMDIRSQLPFIEGGFEEVMANHLLEHLSQDELKWVFSNLHNILKPKGIFRFAVPHMKKEKAWVLSHKTFWNEETVKWLVRDDADTVYGFGKWLLVDVVVNKRQDIHVILEKR